MELLFPLLILALLVPMFLGIRRQKKEMEKTAALQDSLQIGDRVVTTAGLYGTIDDLDEDTVDLEIADGVVTTWSRLVIREVVSEDDIDESDDDIEDEDVAEETADDTARSSAANEKSEENKK
ncbi:MAG: preprotein translocase subunit YajC [Rhodococcus sp.]|mgnify:CR=1 FL=1|nr:preprotein translocase subunit YajC [Rhodococcus sp. (in: high G+C Gram-positive bacteria)]